MLTKTKIQHLRSLHQRKTRYELGLFIVEGAKSILELAHSDLEVVECFITHDFIPALQQRFPLELISETELARITTLTSNHDGVAVVRMPQIPLDLPTHGLILALDHINDPGNLGTIIRTADWYGIEDIIISSDTVDPYNPKAIIASMGSFTRVRVIPHNLSAYLAFIREKHIPIYGATLDGTDIHRMHAFPQDLCLVIGSESHGISPEIASFLTEKITIPRFGGAESLNAWIATAILLDRMRAR